MINIVVEGESDREVGKAVAARAGHEVRTVRVVGGKTKLDPLIPKYNLAAVQHPWVVFRDFDSQCPALLREMLARKIRSWHPQFILRIAHSMSEAWLLADREGFSEYFGVPANRIPGNPEDLANAKQALLGLVARSRSRSIRRDVVAADGLAGPLYVSRINDFASTAWGVAKAEEVSDSLRRAVLRISQIPGMHSVE